MIRSETHEVTRYIHHVISRSNYAQNPDRSTGSVRLLQDELTERGGPQDDELGNQRGRIQHVTHEMDQHQCS